MHRIDRSIDRGVEEWYTKWFDLCFEGKLRNTWLPKSYDLFYKLQNMLLDMCHSSHDQHTHPWMIILSHVKKQMTSKISGVLSLWYHMCLHNVSWSTKRIWTSSIQIRLFQSLMHFRVIVDWSLQTWTLVWVSHISPWHELTCTPKFSKIRQFFNIN